ncbi:LamG domain-containing protein [Streptomyces sp. ML-6]|uniref:LamG domain-containing protein n=1 Tax=Streptomyces sp. ML-6 TaxID=2982693 RepID=UPI0024BF480B|nr:LamG domain-containing protein [Streptomyces sp. ML-6]MDK0521696.1 LamG domain-containing protein [Streptomyces sp. ML-6]
MRGRLCRRRGLGVVAVAALSLVAGGALAPQATAADPAAVRAGSEAGANGEAGVRWSPAGISPKPSGPGRTTGLPQQFGQGQAVKGRWQFEEMTTGAPASTPDSAAQSGPMNLHGGVQLGPGWIDASGLRLNGVDSYAELPAVSVDTSSSFTVTAWVQASELSDQPMTVINAAGNKRSAFALRFLSTPDDSEGFGHWELTLAHADRPGAATRQAGSSEFYDVREWNHLTVVYDSIAEQARLYVNGLLQEFRCPDDDGDGEPDDSTCQDEVAWADDVRMFRADGPLQVGRAMSDTAGEYFAGTIDDVWVFQGALNESQVRWLSSHYFDLPTEVPAGS